MPTLIADPREQLLAFLEQQRSLVRLAAFGLTDEQAAASPSASALSVGGLLKHLAAVERAWTDHLLRRTPPFDEAVADYAAGFRMEGSDNLPTLIADYEAASRATDEALRSMPLDHPVPVPHDVPWFPKDLEAWDAHWVILHLIEETARHAGHADIIRESVDGATWLPLLWAAEKLLPTPWFDPWEPASAAAAATA
ncbi:MAG TPA: DinB family protein [Mycobacteriales bacterium]|nr:DinB family protein [Mycobacteriales bacterium]